MPTGQKWAKNGQISKQKFHSFSGTKLRQIMLLVVFTRCLVAEIQMLGHFRLKSAFLGPNFSRTNIFTAKPNGCTTLFYTFCLYNQENRLSRFFVKLKKLPKMAKNADFSKIGNIQGKSGSVTFDVWSITSGQVSEKSLERLLR